MIFQRKKIFFLRNDTGKTGYPHAKEWSWSLSLHYKTINSKWIIELDLSAKTMKHEEENIGANLHDLVLGNSFLDMTQKAQATKKK